MPIDFTVAIPTYNGALRLPDVLQKLCTQVDTEDCQWEILVVDNNSSDHTAATVHQYQQDWTYPFLLHYCFEPIQGTAFARQRAIKESQGLLIGFIDDDNLPQENWVSAAIQFGQAHPHAGAYGGQIQPDPETPFPDELSSMAQFMAIVKRGNYSSLYSQRQKVLPPGAGLVIRKEAWLKAVPSKLVLNYEGRGSDLASEDEEALIHIQNSAWEIWYNPAMQISHRIDAQRFQRSEILSLMRRVGLSRNRLRMLRLHSWQRPIAFLGYQIFDLLRLSLSYIQNPFGPSIPLTLECRRVLLMSCLMSPYFIWTRIILKSYVIRFYSRNSNL